MFWRKQRSLQVPEKFNRNSNNVTSLMSPEESGLWLLERLQRVLQLPSYKKCALLDFGCGVRFSQTLINRKVPIGQYAGVDCFAYMIDFLTTSVKDRRFSYRLLDVWHPLYNPQGAVRLDAHTKLALPERHFDIATMFSVITHQSPEDAGHIFSMLRRYTRPEGHLFFSCFLDEDLDSFEDRSPERIGGRCVYNPEFLENIVKQAGWRVVGRYPAEAPLIGDSFLCQPE